MSLTKATYAMISGAPVNVLDYGAVGDGVANDTAAFQAAILALRKNPRTILAYIGGPTITAYESGQIIVPEGVYNLQFDTFDITQDIGLTFIGQGSRGKTNYVRGKTVMRFTGTSSGFGFRFAHNGARNGAFINLDLTYVGNNFTGHLVEITGAQGFSATDCYLGTDGDSGATRYTTATSLIRPTYDEFLTIDNCVLNGAQYGWYDDATITILGNTFGGSITRILSSTFYDFAVSHMYSSPARTRTGLVISGVAFNPITVSSVDTIDLSNVTGLLFEGSIFAPSTSSTIPNQWCKLSNVTGTIDACNFGDLCPAGTIDGNLNIVGNYIFSTNGFTLTGGIISGSSNEFAKSTAGFLISPSTTLNFDLGPDEFKPTNVTYSYDIPADSALINGKINYATQFDSSVNKFRNVSARVTVASFAENSFTVATTPYQILTVDTGRLIAATSTSAAQTFTLPASANGISFRIFHAGNQDLIIQRSGANVLYAGTGTGFVSVSIPGSVQGGYIEFQGFGTAGWIVNNVTGTWTFA
jgi:hypothetical protein